MTAEELIAYALGRDNRTSLCTELAQRLSIALDMIEQQEEGCACCYVPSENALNA